MTKHGAKRKREYYPEGYYCRCRIWIERQGETYLGFGRIVLLERIGEFGSILQAAKSMEMSYKQAWDLVDAMNRQATSPLVETRKGGRGGGGAVLTEAGAKAIGDFRALHQRFETFLASESLRLQEDEHLSQENLPK